jgi:hypothetical protein
VRINRAGPYARAVAIEIKVRGGLSPSFFCFVLKPDVFYLLFAYSLISALRVEGHSTPLNYVGIAVPEVHRLYAFVTAFDGSRLYIHDTIQYQLLTP